MVRRLYYLEQTLGGIPNPFHSSVITSPPPEGHTYRAACQDFPSVFIDEALGFAVGIIYRYVLRGHWMRSLTEEKGSAIALVW